jgi:acetyl-CoA acyltransferase
MAGSGIKAGAEKAGLTTSDIDLFEMNEAFAAQILPCIKDLGLMEQIDEKINLNGGAIALGHPLGCSGTRISTTLINLMERKDAQFGPCASVWVRGSRRYLSEFNHDNVPE